MYSIFRCNLHFDKEKASERLLRGFGADEGT